MGPIYLDHAATTPVDPRVLSRMMPLFSESFGNPSSVHALGRKARFIVEESRERMAAHLGAEPGEIVFTSGGTEGDNAAIRSIEQAAARRGLITTAAEHEAVLRPAEALQVAGHPVVILRPDVRGAVTAAQVEAALTGETGLVSVMYVNNEVGTISPLREIVDICHAHGATVHTDAVQAGGLFPLDVKALGVELLTLSAHKLYGPKGVGVLYVSGEVDLPPLIRGGSQERRRRGGTENVAAIAGLAEAFDLAMREWQDRLQHLENLQQYFHRCLHEALEGEFVLNTPLAGSDGAEMPAAPHIINVSFPPKDGRALDGEMLLLNLDMVGIYVSSGSACTSGAVEPSHVLLAMGREKDTAAATVRFSFGMDNTLEEIDYTIDRLSAIVRRMRG